MSKPIQNLPNANLLKNGLNKTYDLYDLLFNKFSIKFKNILNFEKYKW